MNPGESSSSNQNDAPNILNVDVFISDVFARPGIWNRNLERNSLVISNLWNELASKHNRSVEKLKNKWSTLREKFRQKLKRIPRQVDNSYVINPRNIISNWRHYRSMLFMADQITLKPLNEFEQLDSHQNLPIDNFHAKQERIDVPAEEIFQAVKQEAVSINKNKRRFVSDEDENDDLTMKRRKEDLCDNELTTEDLDVDADRNCNEATHKHNNEVLQEPQADNYHYDSQFLMIFSEYVHNVDGVRKLSLISQIHKILHTEIAEML